VILLEDNFPQAHFVLVGYFFSVLLGHIAIYPLIDKLRRIFKWTDPKRSDFTASMLGVVERSLYTTSILLGIEEFISVWILLKVAGMWKGGDEHNRSFLNIFYIGNGLSIAWGVLGGLLINLLDAGNMNESMFLIWLLLMINGLLIFWAYTK